MKENLDIRDAIKSKGICHWQLADEIGIAECTLVVWLRHKLTGERRERVLAAIERIEKRGGVL